VNPNGWDGHFKLSVALGRLALFRGGKEKINLSKEIKAEADTAVALNPRPIWRTMCWADGIRTWRT